MDDSYASANELELVVFAQHGHRDGKQADAIETFPEPSRYSTLQVEERAQTPKSSRSTVRGGMDDVTRVESDDKSVERYVTGC